MRRFLPPTLIFIGLVVLGNAVVPIGLSQLSFSFKPHLIDPTEVAIAPAPYVGRVLGTQTPDHTQANTWFPTADLPQSTNSKVDYFTLSIPSLGVQDVSVEIGGVDLKKNPVQFPGTAIPGSWGNTVIFGHSTLPQLYQPGNPLSIFNPIPKIKIGDEIDANYDGITYKYVVRHTTEVHPEQIEVLAQRYDKHELTIITCVPLGTYLRRFVVRAELVN